MPLKGASALPPLLPKSTLAQVAAVSGPATWKQPLPAPDMGFDTVVTMRGQTLDEIATRYQMPANGVEMLKAFNALPDEALPAGTPVYVPLGTDYGVLPQVSSWKAGETLEKMARRHQVNPDWLEHANKADLSDNGHIDHGLYLPGSREQQQITLANRKADEAARAAAAERPLLPQPPVTPAPQAAEPPKGAAAAADAPAAEAPKKDPDLFWRVGLSAVRQTSGFGLRLAENIRHVASPTLGFSLALHQDLRMPDEGEPKSNGGVGVQTSSVLLRAYLTGTKTAVKTDVYQLDLYGVFGLEAAYNTRESKKFLGHNPPVYVPFVGARNKFNLVNEPANQLSLNVEPQALFWRTGTGLDFWRPNIVGGAAYTHNFSKKVSLDVSAAMIFEVDLPTQKHAIPARPFICPTASLTLKLPWFDVGVTGYWNASGFYFDNTPGFVPNGGGGEAGGTKWLLNISSKEKAF